IDMFVIGRLRPEVGRSHYKLRRTSSFIPLPYYPSLTRPWSAVPAMIRSLRIYWRALERVDAVWLLGPTPLTLAFAVLTRARRRHLFLGVRQDLPRYARSRHPGRRSIHLAADALETANRLLARHHPTIVVGSDLDRRYRAAPRRLELGVSLVSNEDVVSVEQ